MINGRTLSCSSQHLSGQRLSGHVASQKDKPPALPRWRPRVHRDQRNDRGLRRSARMWDQREPRITQTTRIRKGTQNNEAPSQLSRTADCTDQESRPCKRVCITALPGPCYPPSVGFGASLPVGFRIRGNPPAALCAALRAGLRDSRADTGPTIRVVRVICGFFPHRFGGGHSLSSPSRTRTRQSLVLLTRRFRDL